MGDPVGGSIWGDPFREGSLRGIPLGEIPLGDPFGRDPLGDPFWVDPFCGILWGIPFGDLFGGSLWGDPFGIGSRRGCPLWGRSLWGCLLGRSILGIYLGGGPFGGAKGHALRLALAEQKRSMCVCSNPGLSSSRCRFGFALAYERRSVPVWNGTGKSTRMFTQRCDFAWHV